MYIFYIAKCIFIHINMYILSLILPNFLILSLALEITNLGNVFLNILGDHEFFLQKNAMCIKIYKQSQRLHKRPNYIHSWYRRAKRSYSTFKARRGGGEEIPLVQGKEQWLHFAEAAVKTYHTSKVRETQVRWQVLQEGIRGQTH